MKTRTKLAQKGRTAYTRPGTVNLPVTRASTVTFESVAQMQDVQRRFDADETIPTYGMVNMPQRVAFEELMVELEGGYRAATFPTGLAANAYSILACVTAGDHVLMTDSAYSPGRRFCQRSLARFGIETTFYDPLIGAGIEALIRPNTRVVYLESPGSHTFEIQDFPAIAKVAHAHGAAVIHDNAWATGLFFRSFDHGADLVVQPATKYPSGHSDVLLGAVIANEEYWPKLRDVSRDAGQSASPDDLFLAMRGMRTLDARLRRHEASTIEIARKLQAHPKVKRVLYPALESDPGHAIWKRDYLGATGLFGVELVDCSAEKLAAFIESLECFALGYSWGGFDSLVVPQNISKSRSVRPWIGGPLIRLSIGLEDPGDLYDDLAQGLERIQ
jgi:cystathionine beta-lyase